jgi:putative SOS response-associated peptidase YedK
MVGGRMCGRFTLTLPDVEALARELGAELDRARAAPYRPRYNAAPTDLHWVVRLAAGRRLLLPARFGFARPGKPPLVNARSETAARLPTFRAAFREGRCLVPVDGFFEWLEEGGRKRPRWLHRPGGGLLLLAGLCQEQEGGLSFVILTTEASADVRGLHGRMPAILSPRDAASWLEQPDPGLLAPAPEGSLAARAVSLRVNSVANDDPGCLAPAEPPGQGSLRF